jgi:DNA polymerase-3 subunit delta'
VVRFSPLKTADVEAILEQHGISDAEKRTRLARLGSGSVARALALDDDSIWQVRQTIIEGLTSTRPNFQSLAEVWSKFYEDAGKDTAVQRMRVSLVLAFLVETVQNALRLSLGANVSGLTAVEADRLRAFATRVGTDGLMELLEKCVEADYFVDRRVQLILVIESVLEKFLAKASAR